jgi:hypothetical protein|tara:strand:+ start:476 stop:739 length:264 start_codon:yes stop_codon:yes gene_type:complete
MFELTLFNVAQVTDQILAIIGTYLITSINPRIRMYGFICFLVVNIPGIYLLVVTELWWLLAVVPVWLYLNWLGYINNYREDKRLSEA